MTQPLKRSKTACPSMQLPALEQSLREAHVLAVDSKGSVTNEDLDTYLTARREEVGRRLQASLQSNAVAKGWLDELSEEELYEEKEGEVKKYLGDAMAEGDTKAALERVKVAA